jgi:hypothetical protein
MIFEIVASDNRICLTCQGVYMLSPAVHNLHPVYGKVCACPVAAYVGRAAVFCRILRQTLWSLAFEEWDEMPEGFEWTDAPTGYTRMTGP